MKKRNQVSMRSLASELGVSPITVSRALREQTSVRPDLALQIQQFAKKRGYRLDPVVSQVMGGLGREKKTHYRETVAFIWTHPQSDARKEETGAQRMAERLGYKLEVVKPWTEKLSESDVNRILWSRGIRGVLLAPNASTDKPRYDLDWTRFAGILIGSSLVNTGLPRVSRDYFHDAKLAMEQLRIAGFQRIAMVLDASTHERTNRRYAGAFLSNGGSPSRWYITRADSTDSRERSKFLSWRLRVTPDVILLDCARAERWIPARTPLARLFLKDTETGLGIRPDFQRVGAEAMRILDGVLRENRLGLADAPTSILIPGTWESS